VQTQRASYITTGPGNSVGVVRMKKLIVAIAGLLGAILVGGASASW